MVDLNADKPTGASEPNRINRILHRNAMQQFAGLSNLVMIKNKGLDSEKTVELRDQIREENSSITVVRNRIAMKAFLEMGVEDAEKLFDGPTAIIEGEDPVVAAKLAVKICKKYKDKLEIIGGLVEGKVLNAKGVVDLSNAKSKPELLAEIVGLALGPGGGIAAAIKGPGGRLAGAVKAKAEPEEGGEEKAAA